MTMRGMPILRSENERFPYVTRAIRMDVEVVTGRPSRPSTHSRPGCTMPPCAPSHDARVICPAHPSLANFDWLRAYEVSRILHTVVDPKQLEPSLIDPSWRQRNPRELRDAVLESLESSPKLWIDEDTRRASQVAQIPHNLRYALQHSPDHTQLSDTIEYSLDLVRPSEKAKGLKITIHPPRLARPNALYRSYGSARFLTIRLDAKHLAANCKSPLPRYNATRDLVNEFLTRPVRIAQRVFHLFLRKDVRHPISTFESRIRTYHTQY